MITQEDVQYCNSMLCATCEGTQIGALPQTWQDFQEYDDFIDPMYPNPYSQYGLGSLFKKAVNWVKKTGKKVVSSIKQIAPIAAPFLSLIPGGSLLGGLASSGIKMLTGQATPAQALTEAAAGGIADILVKDVKPLPGEGPGAYANRVAKIREQEAEYKKLIMGGVDLMTPDIGAESAIQTPTATGTPPKSTERATATWPITVTNFYFAGAPVELTRKIFEKTQTYDPTGARVWEITVDMLKIPTSNMYAAAQGYTRPAPLQTRDESGLCSFASQVMGDPTLVNAAGYTKASC
jgi:hypothetical protein